MNSDKKQIADEIRAKIDAHCQAIYNEEFRTHLGASLIGDKCLRKLWFGFRWVQKAAHTGRKLRLFNTGNCEETRIIAWLNGAGYEVKNVDTNTGKQFKIVDCAGHFGGSIDGVVNVDALGLCLFEAKSNKTGSEFKAFFDEGMRLNKPRHWAQICTYGMKLNIKNCLYICKNKDNDDLYIEPVELDFEHGKEMIEKASYIIGCQDKPSRISETPTYFECKMCDYTDICHRGKQADNNCRSCKFASAVEDAQWKCEKYGIIPKEEIGKPKPCWEGII